MAYAATGTQASGVPGRIRTCDPLLRRYTWLCELSTKYAYALLWLPATLRSIHIQDPGHLTVSATHIFGLEPRVATWLAPATVARCGRAAPRAEPSAVASRRDALPARDGAAGRLACRLPSTNAPAPPR